MYIVENSPPPKCTLFFRALKYQKADCRWGSENLCDADLPLVVPQRSGSAQSELVAWLQGNGSLKSTLVRHTFSDPLIFEAKPLSRTREREDSARSEQIISGRKEAR